MEAVRVLDRLKQSGVHLEADGDQIIIGSDKPLTDEQRAFLSEHKAEFLGLLEPSYAWLVSFQDIRSVERYQTAPEAIRAEIVAEYPDAIRIEPFQSQPGSGYRSAQSGDSDAA